MKLFGIFLSAAAALQASAAGIEGTLTNGVLSLHSEPRFAGAISSVYWAGTEFINNTDHGRQMQIAWSGNGDVECYNPTEAGTRYDGAGPTSTSQLLSYSIVGNRLNSTTLPAFWMAPGTTGGQCRYSGEGAVNTQWVASSPIRKQITLGVYGMAQAFEVITNIDLKEDLTQFQLEALTGYLTSAFPKFFRWTTAGYSALPTDYTEITDPVIVSNANEQYAMGVWSPGDSTGAATLSYGYGFFPGADGGTSKWTVVYRRNATPKNTTYTYKTYVCVGTLTDVSACLGRTRALYLQTHSSAFSTGLQQLYQSVQQYPATAVTLPSMLSLAADAVTYRNFPPEQFDAGWIYANAPLTARVLAVGLDNHPHEKHRTLGGGWTSFAPIAPELSVKSGAMIADYGGRAQAFLVGTDGIIYFKNTVNGGASWGPLGIVGNDTNTVQAIQVIGVPDGLRQIYAIGQDLAVWMKTCLPDGIQCTPFAQVGNSPAQVKALSVIGNPATGAQIYAIGLDNAVWVKQSFGTPWSPFARLEEDGAKVLALSVSGNPSVGAHLYVVGLDSFSWFKQSFGTAWGTFVRIDASIPLAAIATNGLAAPGAGNGVDRYGLSTDGRVFLGHYTAPYSLLGGDDSRVYSIAVPPVY